MASENLLSSANGRPPSSNHAKARSWFSLRVLSKGIAQSILCICECVLVAESWPTLWDPMDCSPPGSSVHGILQARILEWVAIPFSRSSQPRDLSRVSRIAGRFFTLWATNGHNLTLWAFLQLMVPSSLSFSFLISLHGTTKPPTKQRVAYPQTTNLVSPVSGDLFWGSFEIWHNCILPPNPDFSFSRLAQKTVTCLASSWFPYSFIGNGIQQYQFSDLGSAELWSGCGWRVKWLLKVVMM